MLKMTSKIDIDVAKYRAPGEHVVVLSAPAEVLVREAIAADKLFTRERCDATEQFNVRQSDNTMYMYVCVYMYGT